MKNLSHVSFNDIIDGLPILVKPIQNNETKLAFSNDIPTVYLLYSLYSEKNVNFILHFMSCFFHNYTNDGSYYCDELYSPDGEVIGNKFNFNQDKKIIFSQDDSSRKSLLVTPNNPLFVVDEKLIQENSNRYRWCLCLQYCQKYIQWGIENTPFVCYRDVEKIGIVNAIISYSIGQSISNENSLENFILKRNKEIASKNSVESVVSKINFWIND